MALFAFAAFGANPALATLIGQSLTVELISPNDGNLHLTDMVVASGPGDILPGDGSAIGAVMLSTEFMDFGLGGTGDRIVIGLEEGVPGGLTGYGAQARYVISGLYAGTGFLVGGVSVSTTNITGVTTSFTANSVTVFIDTLVIGEIPGIDSGSVILDLTIVPIPEPGTATLVLLGLAGLALRARRGTA